MPYASGFSTDGQMVEVKKGTSTYAGHVDEQGVHGCFMYSATWSGGTASFMAWESTGNKEE